MAEDRTSDLLLAGLVVGGIVVGLALPRLLGAAKRGVNVRKGSTFPPEATPSSKPEVDPAKGKAA